MSQGTANSRPMQLTLTDEDEMQQADRVTVGKGKQRTLQRSEAIAYKLLHVFVYFSFF
jgi:hypothetical protein